MKLSLKKQEKGFTIIEVLIVLAIAGLIMLIVFLAVPALQRNSRNTQRSNDASKVAAAINECLSNRNGQTSSCITTANLQGLDTSKLSVLTTVTAPSATSPYNATAPGNNTTITWGFGQVCAADGATATTSNANARSAVVLYSAESATGGTTTKCLSI